MHVTGPGTGDTAESRTSTILPFMEFALHSNEDKHTWIPRKEITTDCMQAMEKRKQSGGGKRVGEGKGRYLFWKMVSLPGSGNSMCKDSEERLRTEGLGTKKRTVRWELREREGGREGVRPAPMLPYGWAALDFIPRVKDRDGWRFGFQKHSSGCDVEDRLEKGTGGSREAPAEVSARVKARHGTET